MKLTKTRLGTPLLAALLLLMGGLSAQTYSRFVIQPGSRLWMEGTSNVHSWTVEAADLAGYVEVVLPFEPTAAGATASIDGPQVELFVPVAGLKSGHWIMDKKMAAALRATRHPMIHFILSQRGLSAATRVARGSFTLLVSGVLEVAGVWQVVELDVEINFLADGRLTIKGGHVLKMSDFGIEAPKALGGLLVTGDEIEIGFDLAMSVDPNLASLLLRSWSATASN